MNLPTLRDFCRLWKFAVIREDQQIASEFSSVRKAAGPIRSVRRLLKPDGWPVPWVLPFFERKRLPSPLSVQLMSCGVDDIASTLTRSCQAPRSRQDRQDRWG